MLILVDLRKELAWQARPIASLELSNSGFGAEQGPLMKGESFDNCCNESDKPEYSDHWIQWFYGRTGHNFRAKTRRVYTQALFDRDTNPSCSKGP